MFHEKKTWRLPRLRGSSWTGDYRSGWMCYQWQTHTYNALEPIVKAGKCFDIRRVGLVTYHEGTQATYIPWADGNMVYVPESPPFYTLDHNWVAISAVRKSGMREASPAGKCTVYLDPWKGGASGVYRADKEHHVLHNFQVCFTNGSNTAPTGGRGWVLAIPGKPIGEDEEYETFGIRSRDLTRAGDTWGAQGDGDPGLRKSRRGRLARMRRGGAAFRRCWAREKEPVRGGSAR